MTQIQVEEKQVVVPGELLATGMDLLPGFGAYRKEENIYANRVGLVSINGRAIKLIPLTGKYLPKRDDVIVGRVTDITMSGWRIDTNTAFSAMLNVRDASNAFISRSADLSKILAIGDYVMCKITQVTTQKLIDVSMKGPGLRKLYNGQLVKFSPNKFPRIIGRQGSMVSMVKHATGCHIYVGQNGLIWISGEPKMEVLAARVIQMIETYAHTSGLTERVKAFLTENGAQVPAEQTVQDADLEAPNDEEDDEQNESQEEEREEDQ